MYSNSTENVQGRDRYLYLLAGNPTLGSQSVIGPAHAIRLAGPSLRLDREGNHVAIFRDGQWQRRNIGGRFSLLWTECGTALDFENPATGSRVALGTFDMVGIVGDTIHVDREHSRPAAVLDQQSGLWRCCTSGTLWPEIVLRPAPSMDFRGSNDLLGGKIVAPTLSGSAAPVMNGAGTPSAMPSR